MVYGKYFKSASISQSGKKKATSTLVEHSSKKLKYQY